MDYRLLVLALGTFSIGTDSYVVAGILPHVAQSSDASVAAAGQFVTVYALTYAILSPVMAALTAHWPRKRVLLWGLVVFVAGNILTGAAPTFDLALLGRAIAGLGGAMFTPVAGATAAALVTPERRGHALAVVLAGLSAATAFGAPLGTLVASFGDWRLTMWFVAGLALLAFLGVLTALPAVAAPPALRLRDRLAPLGDPRVAAVLATTLVAMFGVFMIYTYISVVFDRATGGDGRLLAGLLSIWGIGATIGSLGAGKLVDRFGNRRIINAGVTIVALDFALMPWSSTSFIGGAIALLVWGICGWGFVVSQQHRLVGIKPALAPVLLALNASAIYAAISASGAIGALAIGFIDPHRLPLLSAAVIIIGLSGAELAYRLIRGKAGGAAPSAVAAPVGR